VPLIKAYNSFAAISKEKIKRKLPKCPKRRCKNRIIENFVSRRQD
jgi:hypothetical protein